jgi:CRISPR type III-B/RAMP module RAMP protein Cmr6
VTIAQLEGRLAINLADSLIQNAGICLDRLFGLPFIPGSAIKGVCRHAALAELRAAAAGEQSRLFDVFRAIFGTSDNDFAKGELRPFQHLLSGRAENQKGAVAFLPAYPVNEARVVVDLTNVHYPEYYRTGRTEALSNERPQPNPFPAVEVGAQFAVCLILNGIADDPNLLQTTARWLEAALTVHGLGAKTASGYGWFSLRPDVLQQLLDEDRREVEAEAAKVRAVAEAEAKAEAERQRRNAMPPDDLAVETLLKLSDEAFATAAKELANKPEPEQRAMLRLLREHKEKRDRWKTWKKKKPELAAAIEAVRMKLNAPALP